eukprot:CAMPEP_0170182080 /NCGR_PEP_ID=MMETSP0040_2-20121228/26867_1 /TAXON_ID=641309 /ORGANISM="Lotharella oceanica, Strain CCMP622" /LENGTH=69 /DNA_ID=CAMNT_0010427369 /DNA_START=304 /DNA_END=509 /DNA_ORIENTATION=+
MNVSAKNIDCAGEYIYLDFHAVIEGLISEHSWLYLRKKPMEIAFHTVISASLFLLDASEQNDKRRHEST